MLHSDLPVGPGPERRHWGLSRLWVVTRLANDWMSGILETWTRGRPEVCGETPSDRVRQRDGPSGTLLS